MLAQGTSNNATKMQQRRFAMLLRFMPYCGNTVPVLICYVTTTVYVLCVTAAAACVVWFPSTSSSSSCSISSCLYIFSYPPLQYSCYLSTATVSLLLHSIASTTPVGCCCSAPSYYTSDTPPLAALHDTTRVLPPPLPWGRGGGGGGRSGGGADNRWMEPLSQSPPLYLCVLHTRTEHLFYYILGGLIWDD